MHWASTGSGMGKKRSDEALTTFFSLRGGVGCVLEHEFTAESLMQTTLEFSISRCHSQYGMLKIHSKNVKINTCINYGCKLKCLLRNCNWTAHLKCTAAFTSYQLKGE